MSALNYTLVVLFVTGIIALIVLPPWYNAGQNANHQQHHQAQVTAFQSDLVNHGYEVLNATFDSPKLTVVCYSVADFYSRAAKLNASTVYVVNGEFTSTFYVVDSTVTFAYSYTISEG